MACYFPWSFNASGGASRPLACGRCIGCRLEYTRQWGVRCMHEASMHKFNVFVNPTYNDSSLPLSPSGLPTLRYGDWQLFMRYLRRTGRKVRFFMSGEYGEDNGRPHYHALLFNCWFPDMKYWRRSDSGFKLYRSAELESLWTRGNIEVGMVSFESARYCAKYVIKKIGGEMAAAHYGDRVPEFARMSLKPGIGAEWFEKFGWSDVLPDGQVVVNGRKSAAPRFYRERLKFYWPDRAEKQAMERHAAITNARWFEDNAPDRLCAKEAVKRAAIKEVL